MESGLFGTTVMDDKRFRKLTSVVNNVLSKQHFFICAAPKSGTTWLQKTLDAHPEVVCSGEGHFIGGLAHYLKNALASYDNTLQRVKDQVYEGKPYYTSPKIEELEYLLLCQMSFMMARREIGPKVKWVGDKTPANAQFMAEIARVLPEARFIHIIRDGRDVALSTKKHAERMELLEKFNFKAVAEKWGRYVTKARKFGKQFPKQYHELRYEDMNRDPEGELTKILKFLNVEASAKTVKKCCDEASFNKLSGGRKKGEEKLDSFFRKGVVGDWEKELAPQEIELFMKCNGKVLKELKYAA